MGSALLPLRAEWCRICAVLRCAGGLLAVAAALALAATSAAATAAKASSGPEIGFFRKGSNPFGGSSLFRAGYPTLQFRRLAGRGERSPFLEGLSWSGDGSTLAYARSRGLFDTSIWLVRAGLENPRKVRGTRDGMLPVLSPDGTTIAFSKFRIVFGKGLKAKFSGRSIWLVAVDGGRPRQLTPWRNRVMTTPTSFSQDGSTLAMTWETLGGRSAAKGIRLVDKSEFLIRKGMAEPIYSPDGSRIAAIKRRGSLWSKGDLFVMNSDGSGPQRITRTPSTIESTPSWDPSGERLVFTRMPHGLVFEPFGPGTAVIEMNTDGTCPRRLLFDRRVGFYGAAWRPGPGREAGRIAC